MVAFKYNLNALLKIYQIYELNVNTKMKISNSKYYFIDSLLLYTISIFYNVHLFIY